MLDVLLAALKRDKGFSFDILRQTFAPQAGYAVSAHKSRESIISNFAALSQTYLQNRIAVYIVQNLDVLLTHGHVLGAWVDGNKCYLDIATVVPTRETAELLAQEHSQLAFYDLAAGETISTSKPCERSN